MSRKYKEAMDKIVVSDDLKRSIMAKAALKEKTVSKSNRSKLFCLRYAAACAACLLICAAAVSVHKYMISTDVLPSASSTPSATAVPSGSSEPAKTEKPAASQSPEENQASGEQKINNIILKNQTPSEREPSEGSRLEEGIIKTGEAAPSANEQDSSAAATGTPTDIPPLSSVSPSSPEPEPPSGGEFSVLQPAPSLDLKDFSEIREQLGYEVKLPQKLPQGYQADSVSLLFGELLQISYTKEDNTILYRTQKTSGDISGDYNIYEKVETKQINGTDVTLKSSGDLCYTAIWNDGESSYSLYSREGLTQRDMILIIEDIDEPSETN